MDDPQTAARGSDVAFNCSFNLQDDDLYAVKWYRGTYEIFRQVGVLRDKVNCTEPDFILRKAHLRRIQAMPG